MKKIYFIFCILFSSASVAQITFEKGYIITDGGVKTSVLIKNKDWRNNPTEIVYKLSENSTLRYGTLQSIKEFSISNKTNYIRAKVKVDTSSNEIVEMSKMRRPEFKEKIVFLKAIILGKASLYSYQTAGFQRYFYSVNEGKITQLIYKKYRPKGKAIATNRRFRQQLLNHVNCKDVPKKSFKKIDYSKHDLSKYFKKINKCKNVDFVSYAEKKEYDFFNLRVRLGLVNSSLHLLKYGNKRKGGFENAWSARIGVEAEFILPFNKNKWAIFVEPTYLFSYEQKFILKNYDNRERPTKLEYHAIDIPIGVRYYIFLNKQSKLFINGSLVLNYSLDSS